ncbi:MAG: ATP-grasp domain-containing protein [Tannerellaceae bacterium]|jgi:biotin carboxylase|nr:ATP-grasp domain-containing protein [Tannerellaceae bacterium]
MEKRQKRLLLLGGTHNLIAVIKTAHKLGYYVITCDYLPNNIAHKYSDEYCNLSVTDKEAVLRLAIEKRIDGILSFAIDPGVVTAGYVADKLGLPGASPYPSVCILQNKALFRNFLKENGFNVPKAKGYKTANEALKDVDHYNWPVIVKPVDSSGSKGVSKLCDPIHLGEAIETALQLSLSDEFIIEEFIETRGYPFDSECFSVNGKMKFVSFANQYFDSGAANPYTPSGYNWPASMSDSCQLELRNEFQRLISLLHMGTSIYNVETRVGVDGKAYIMEVSPRGGGNRLAEVLYYVTGVDLIAHTLRAAVGDELQDIKDAVYYDGEYWATIILHSDRKGIFRGVQYDEHFPQEVIKELDFWVKKGDAVRAFSGGSDAIGIIVMTFETEEQLSTVMTNPKRWIKVIVE